MSSATGYNNASKYLVTMLEEINNAATISNNLATKHKLNNKTIITMNKYNRQYTDKYMLFLNTIP